MRSEGNSPAEDGGEKEVEMEEKEELWRMEEEVAEEKKVKEEVKEGMR